MRLETLSIKFLPSSVRPPCAPCPPWFIIGLFLLLASPVQGGDWPQILGPTRNGIAQKEGLADRWPSGGPTVVWEREVGSGFAGVAVSKGTLVLFHRDGDEELAEGLDALTGSPRWKVGFPTQYSPSFTSDDGPRCVPLIHDDFVYLYGAGRGLRCVALADGEKRWTRELMGEYATEQDEGYFGAGSSPIIEGGALLLNLGAARAKAGLVAFALDTGKTLWKATDEQASYSSPVATDVDGLRQVIFVTRFNVVAVEAKTGKVFWKFPFGARGPTVNAASPVVLDDHVFVTASYGVGAVWAEMGKSDVKQIWASDVMSSQYTTSVAMDGMLYGIDGREDQGPANLMCLDPRSGKAAWVESGFGKASIILADGKLVILKTNGQLVLVRPSAESFQMLASAEVLDSKSFPLPALASGLLYVRDTKTLKCLELTREAPARGARN